MKMGDLVQMKYEMFWRLKGNRNRPYTDDPALVLSLHAKGIKVLYPDGTVRCDLVDHFKVINKV